MIEVLSGSHLLVLPTIGGGRSSCHSWVDWFDIDTSLVLDPVTAVYLSSNKTLPTLDEIYDQPQRLALLALTDCAGAILIL